MAYTAAALQREARLTEWVGEGLTLVEYSGTLVETLKKPERKKIKIKFMCD